MNVLSRYLMVTGGNVTGLTDELERDGLVTREDDPSDRRSFLLCLTDAGQQTFETIAAAHEAWLVELCAGVDTALSTHSTSSSASCACNWRTTSRERTSRGGIA